MVLLFFYVIKDCKLRVLGFFGLLVELNKQFKDASCALGDFFDKPSFGAFYGLND